MQTLLVGGHNQDSQPDIVILDLLPSDMDGSEVLRRFSQERQRPHSSRYRSHRTRYHPFGLIWAAKIHWLAC